MLRLPSIPVIIICLAAVLIGLVIFTYSTSAPTLAYDPIEHVFPGSQTLAGDPPSEAEWGRLGEHFFKWVDDLTGDGIPDLIFTYSTEPPPLIGLGSIEDWIWAHRVYSGSDGNLVHESTWNDGEIEVHAILGSSGSIGSIQYLVNSPSKGVGRQSIHEHFISAPFPISAEALGRQTWYESAVGPIASSGGSLLPNSPGSLAFSVGLLDSPGSVTKIDWSRDSWLFFVPNSKANKAPEAVANLGTGGWQSDFDGFELKSFEIASGKLLHSIRLDTSGLADFRPDSILASHDVDGNGVSDWLIEHTVKLPSGGHCDEFIWFDGKNGKVLTSHSAAWSRLKTSPPLDPYPTFATTRSGIMEIVDWPDGAVNGKLAYRTWNDSSYVWKIDLKLESWWGPSQLRVTEFEDLDGDTIPDFGFAVMSMEGQTTLIGTYQMPSMLVEARLISGATGAPLVQTLNKD